MRNRPHTNDVLESTQAESTLESTQAPHAPQHRIPLINLQAQYKAYKSHINSAISRTLHSQSFILSAQNAQLERELCAFVGRRFCITCSSGTSALLLALMALGVSKGDEVITPTFSFISAAEMIASLGAKPVFVDIDPLTLMLDIAQVQSRINKHTKAIIPVSIFGTPYPFSELRHALGDLQIPIIEDGAQSFGAYMDSSEDFTNTICGNADSGIDSSADSVNADFISVDSSSATFGADSSVRHTRIHSGTLGTLSITSFFPSKPLGCYGDGGAVLCDDEELAHRLQILRNHGQSSKYQHEILGLNARLDSLQCAILSQKLRFFSQELERRAERAKRYYELLTPLESNLQLPYISPRYTSVFAQFCVRVKDSILDYTQQNSDQGDTQKAQKANTRYVAKSPTQATRSPKASSLESTLQQLNATRAHYIHTLHKHHIATAIHYPKPLHLQKAFSYLGHKLGDFPISERVSSAIFSIPFCAFITEREQQVIAHALREATLTLEIHR